MSSYSSVVNNIALWGHLEGSRLDSNIGQMEKVN